MSHHPWWGVGPSPISGPSDIPRDKFCGAERREKEGEVCKIALGRQAARVTRKTIDFGSEI